MIVVLPTCYLRAEHIQYYVGGCWKQATEDCTAQSGRLGVLENRSGIELAKEVSTWPVITVRYTQDQSAEPLSGAIDIADAAKAIDAVMSFFIETLPFKDDTKEEHIDTAHCAYFPWCFPRSPVSLFQKPVYRSDIENIFWIWYNLCRWTV